MHARMTILAVGCLLMAAGGCNSHVTRDEPGSYMVESKAGWVDVKTTYLLRPDGRRIRHGPQTVLDHVLIWQDGDPWEGVSVLSPGCVDMDFRVYREGKVVAKGSEQWKQTYPKYSPKLRDSRPTASTAFGEQQVSQALPNLEKARALLLAGDRLAREGKADEAWSAFCKAREQFSSAAIDLSSDYVEVIAQNLLKERRTREAIRVLRGFIIKNHKNPKVTDRERAKVQLLIGDAYFSEERYEIARDEYNTVLTLPEYKDLPERVEAQFRVCLTLMAQKVYRTCEKILGELSESDQKDVAARAHGTLSVLYSLEGEAERAKQESEKAVAMGYPEAEIKKCLGRMRQVGAKYKEALERLRRGCNPQNR